MSKPEDGVLLQATEGSSLSSHGNVFRSMAIVEDGALEHAMKLWRLAHLECVDGWCWVRQVNVKAIL